MFVFKAAVVGAGTMGGEIAQALAAADVEVVLKDVDQKFVDIGLEKAREVTAGQVGRLVKKGKVSEEQADTQVEALMARITGTTTYEGFGDVDFVVEAVPEKMELKQRVFTELDDVTPGHAILSSNTSSLSITEIADATSRPEKVCGFHFFYPASVMPLLEIVEGDETAPETVTTAVNLAQKIRKQPITCAEVPGFVVNRILNSSISEIWRAQEERGLSIKAIDDGVGAANVAPMGPFFLVDLLGLDTVVHVAEHLEESYGDRFYVHRGMRRLVDQGKLGAKTGGDGFYKDGEAQIPGDEQPDAQELADLFTLKMLVEACLVLEEGVATTRAIDLGLMAGAGLDPRRGILPPFMKADITGLDVVLEQLEEAEEKYGDRFEPPAILRRLVGQGRLGQKTGQGFFPWPRPDEGFADGPVKLETRGEIAIAWLDNPPANSLSPDVIAALQSVWEHVESSGARALVFASANPMLFCAGADIKAFTTLDEASGAQARRGRPRAHARHGAVARRDHRRGQRDRLRRRLRARDGLRRAHRRRVGGLRPARDQPRDHPRLRRHPAAAAPGRVEQGAGDEPHGRRGARRGGVRVRAGQPGRPRPRAARHRAAVGAQARRPGAARGRGHQAGQRQGRPRRGPGRREAGVRRRCSRPRTRRRASPPSSASGARRGRAGSDGRRAPRGAAARRGLGRRPDGRGDLRAVRDPRLPHARDGPVGERRPDGGRAHRRVAARPRALLALLRRPLPDAEGQGAQRRARRARRARAPRRARRGGHAEHRHAAPQGRHGGPRRGARDDRALVVPVVRRDVPARRGARPPGRRPDRASRAATASSR